MRAFTLIPVFLGLPVFANLIDTLMPHLIIPLISSTPNTTYGTQKDATISSNNSTGVHQYTEVSFDVPANEATYCRLNFLINKDPVKNAPRTLSGVAPYAINATRLEPKINKDTDTWNSHPGTTDFIAQYVLNDNGQVYTVTSNTFVCPKGQVAQFLITPGTARDIFVYWFELDYPANQGGKHGIVLEMHT